MSDVDYRSFVESVPLVPWEADAQTWHFTYVGPQAVDLLGFPLSDWYEPSFWKSRIHPLDRSRAVSTCMKLSAEGGSFELEYRMVRSDETVLWVKDAVTVIMGDTGPIALRGFLIDITDSKRVSDALSQSENMGRQLLRSTPDALLIVRSDGTIVQFNRGAEELFRCSAAELKGSPIDRFVPDRLASGHAKHREAFAKAPRHRPMGEGLELVAQRRDGSEIPVEISLRPMETDQGPLVLASVRDVTTKRRMESELRASEQEFRLLANSLPSLIAMVTPDQRYHWVNEKFCEWFGLDRTEIVNRLVRDVVGEEAYAGAIRPRLEAALQGESTEYDTVLPSLGGGWSPVSVAYVPRFDDEGAVSGCFVKVTDLTEREESRSVEQSHRNALAHVLRVATMGELTTSIAHELNQPLAAITTNAQAATRFLAMTPPDTAEIDSALEDIAGDAKRAAEVIRRMRDLLRKGTPSEEAVDIASLITGTVELLRSDAVAKGISVTVDCAADLPLATGDSVQLQQVVLNLMMNAFDAVLKGDTDSGTLKITASLSDGRVEVTFSDNGSGLPDDLEANCFAPFASSKSEGLGMGLTIARTLAEAQGGSLIGENHPDGGTRFRLFILVNRDDRPIDEAVQTGRLVRLP